MSASTADTAVADTVDLIDDDARDRLVVRGSDAATYLQSQLSQTVADLTVGSARWSFVLEPNGKVAVLARVTRTADDEFVLDTDAGFGEAMQSRVTRFMIRVDVTTELQLASAAAPSDDHERRRVAAGWPRMGAEIHDGQTIPATTGVVPLAVNFTKGCYPGQELVERMDSRGADAPRRPVVVDAAGRSVGDSVVVDDADVGSITSVSPDGDLAIASVKRGVDVGRPPAHLADVED
ncbi:MAG: hypothetical protein AAGG08_00930 [Actinomycetota bacterium]